MARAATNGRTGPDVPGAQSRSAPHRGAMEAGVPGAGEGPRQPRRGSPLARTPTAASV